MQLAEIEKLAVSIWSLLADPDLDLNEPLRRRGALAALAAVLGDRWLFSINCGARTTDRAPIVTMERLAGVA
jgi:hypothetical protein